MGRWRLGRREGARGVRRAARGGRSATSKRPGEGNHSSGGALAPRKEHLAPRRRAPASYIQFARLLRRAETVTGQRRQVSASVWRHTAVDLERARIYGDHARAVAPCALLLGVWSHMRLQAMRTNPGCAALCTYILSGAPGWKTGTVCAVWCNQLAHLAPTPAGTCADTAAKPTPQLVLGGTRALLLAVRPHGVRI